MKGTISKIERQKRHANRFNVYIDGDYATSVHEDVLVQHRLHKGQVLQESDWLALLSDEEKNKAKQQALRYISFKRRTSDEVARHLQEKGNTSETILLVLTWLQSCGYIDDRAYAKDWVSERSRSKGKGRYAIKREMQVKGIDERWISEALHLIDDGEERELARTWAHKRYEHVKHLAWPHIERRIGSFLARRGFPHELIMSVLSELRDHHTNDDRH